MNWTASTVLPVSSAEESSRISEADGSFGGVLRGLARRDVGLTSHDFPRRQHLDLLREPLTDPLSHGLEILTRCEAHEAQIHVLVILAGQLKKIPRAHEDMTLIGEVWPEREKSDDADGPAGDPRTGASGDLTEFRAREPVEEHGVGRIQFGAVSRDRRNPQHRIVEIDADDEHAVATAVLRICPIVGAGVERQRERDAGHVADLLQIKKGEFDAGFQVLLQRVDDDEVAVETTGEVDGAVGHAVEKAELGEHDHDGEGDAEYGERKVSRAIREEAPGEDELSEKPHGAGQNRSAGSARRIFHNDNRAANAHIAIARANTKPARPTSM